MYCNALMCRIFNFMLPELLTHNEDDLALFCSINLIRNIYVYLFTYCTHLLIGKKYHTGIKILLETFIKNCGWRHAVVLSIPKPAIWCIKFCSSFFSVQCTLYRVISTLILRIDVMSFDAADDIITTNYLSYYFSKLKCCWVEHFVLTKTIFRTRTFRCRTYTQMCRSWKDNVRVSNFYFRICVVTLYLNFHYFG